MIMINAWSIRRGIKRVENVQNGRFDSRFPQLSFAFLIFAASPIMSGIVRLTVLYARARANYGNPCKFNKYSYLMDLIRFTNVYTEPECWHLSSVRSWFPKLRCFQPNQLLFHFDVGTKLLFINQLIVGWGGVGIGSIETNIEIYMLCVGNITGSLENTKHTNIKGEVLK